MKFKQNMKPQKKVFKNGLRAIVVPMPESPTVTTLVLVEAGSHYEEKKQNGVSHFLEHMCFKGTENRPSPSLIAHELDALGAESNAFTWYEFTGYYAKARAKNFTKIFDVIADLYLNPIIQKDELEKERGVIIEEINMYEDLPMRNVSRLLDEVMYGDQPAGRSVLGTKEIIRTIKREDFVSYRDAHYVPEATTVVIAGNVVPAEAFKQIEKQFGSLTRQSAPKKPRVKDTQKAPAIKVHYKKSHQAHFQLGFRSLTANDKNLPILAVLRAVLGQGMSSRLFRKLREEMGVCYYVKTDVETHSDHGKFIIASGVDISRINLVLTTILDELRHIQKESITEEELQKAKEYHLGTMVMGLEASDEVAEYFGAKEILHTPLTTPEEYIKEVRRVTPRQVQKLAKEIFKHRSLNLAVIGPFKDGRQFKKIIKL